jgi:tetratricopeptide (TPR) repeat protein
LSAAVSVVLGELVGQSLFPNLNVLRGSGPRTFAGIDRDSDAAALPPFEPPEDEGSPARVDILRALHGRDFATLGQMLDAKRVRVAQDIRHESEWHRVMATFDIADQSMTPLIEEWVASSPESIVPYIASGTHMYSLAFDARGTRPSANTTPEQFAGMERYLEKAERDARAALERDPQEVLGYQLLINVARAGGTQAECGTIAREGLEVAPASLRIRWALAICRLPRWGGSHRSVTAIWDRAKPFVADHPALAVLGGVVAWDLGRLAEGEEAMRHFESAVAAGPAPVFFLARASAYLDAKQDDAALEDAAAGLAMAPDDPDLLEVRFRALSGLGRISEANSALELLAEIEPTNRNVPSWREYVQRQRGSTAVDGTGGHYARGRAHVKAGDEQAALAEFEAALRQNPSHFDACLSIDLILAPRREWDVIIGHWTTYLAIQPGDGRAYLERGGAYHQKGDVKAARADIERACEIGTERACAIAKSQGWQ